MNNKFPFQIRVRHFLLQDEKIHYKHDMILGEQGRQ